MAKMLDFTRDAQLGCFKPPSRTKPLPASSYQDATKKSNTRKFNEIVCLRNHIRRAQSSAAAPQYGIENVGADSNARSNPKKRTLPNIETTIPSYLVARPSRDLPIAAHQQITRRLVGVSWPPVRRPVGFRAVLEETARKTL